MPYFTAKAGGFFRLATLLILFNLYNSESLVAAPTADFSASVLNACTNTPVVFTNTSTGTVSTYSWNFGSGATPATSSGAGPVTVSYSTAGLKTISLTVNGIDGSASVTKTDYVSIISAPVMSGSITGSTAICANAQNVTYNITAIANAASYLWTLPAGSSIASGSGSNSISVNFGTASGNVCVTATNTCGNSSQLCKAVTVGTDQVKIMTYNLLNYPDAGNLTTDTSTRNPYFRTTLAATDPDILAVQEVTSVNGINIFLSNVMNARGNIYAAGTFIDGFDSDNGIFYKTSKFTFISNTRYRTDLRDINEFKLVHILSGDTLRIYSVHLKASAGSSEEAQRALEIDTLRKVTNALPAGSKFLVVGDFNIYRSGESAYQKLLAVDPASEGHFIDPLTLSGTWNNSTYAPFHTQSTRTRAFNGGSTGGLDDRFDLILFSKSISLGTTVSYVSNSMTAFGNDGNHYGDSINMLPNSAVSSAVANALHYSADHLPVFATFQFQNATCPYADLGVTNILSPAEPSCADPTELLQIRVKNFGTNSVNFSSNNLLVTMNVTLPDNSTQSFSKIISSGILNALGTTDISFDNTLDMSAQGSYSFNAATVFSGDTVAANNSVTSIVNVYQNASQNISSSGATTFCTGGSVVLTADQSAGITYQWQKNAVDISGATASTLSVNQPGSYRCVQQKSNAVSVTNPSRVFTNNNAFSIPDNSCTPATSIISVTGYTNTIATSGISVKINITHQWVGDLVFYLEAPNGDRLGLSNRTGNNSNNGDNFTNTVFSDAGSTVLPTTGAPYTGIFKPASSVFTVCSATTTKTSFAGIGNGNINPNGSWKLIVYDRANPDAGTIVNWQITFPSYTIPFTLVCDPVISNAVNVVVNNLPTISISPSSPTVCNSGSVTLTSSGASTYNWTPATGLNTTTGSVVISSVTAPIIYTVTGTDVHGCTATASKSVSINQSPIVTLTTPNAVCVNGNAITLNGGNPTGGSYSGNGVSGNTFFPSIAGSGNHLITYSYTASNGCSASATSTIVVNALPNAAINPTGPIVLCQGNSVVLSASSGNSYLWSTGEITSSISVSAAGNYSVQVTDAIGCSSTSATVNVTLSAFQMSGTVFNETAGTPGGTVSILNWQNQGGFSSSGLLFYGTGDIRNTSTSAGYTGSSGGGNIFLSSTAGTYFGISRINTAGLSNLQLSFGVFKSTLAASGADLQILVSTDSVNWTALTFPALSTASGSATWANRTITSGIPAASTVYLRFTNLNSAGSSNSYRLDDLILRYTINSPTISASGNTTICQGGSINLTSTPSLSYLWNTGETTRSISATSSGIRYCNVTGDNGCVATSNAINVSVNPEIYTVSGSGSYCNGSTGLPVILSGSENTVTYQLQRNGVNDGSPVNGSGTLLNFGNKTAGNYSVVATNSLLACTASMNGTAVVLENASPAVYQLTGGGSFCIGTNGVEIGLSGSENGSTYQLFVNGNANPVLSIPGNGGPISFGFITTPGNYTATALTTTNCGLPMNGQVTVSVHVNPLAFDVTGGGNFCSGGNGMPIGLSGTENGIDYSLILNNLSVGVAAGNGNAISFGTFLQSGSYSVVAMNPITGCTMAMNATAEVQVLARPFIYNVTGGGDYCSSDLNGLPVGLNHSDSTISYELYFQNIAQGNVISGIESAVSFGNFLSAGIYSVVATATNGCTSEMNGNAIITIDQATNWFADMDGDGFGDITSAIMDCEQPAGFVTDNSDCNDTITSVYPGAMELCGNGMDDNCDGTIDENCSPTLHVKIFLQGFYRNGQMISLFGNGVTDTITISLASANAPYLIVYSAITTIAIDGNASVTFPTNALGQNYFLVIDHRQSLQTWSAVPFQFISGMQINFTQSAGSVYGNNLISLSNGFYGIITGDLDRDGIISLADLDIFGQNIAAFASGYLLEDLNGDSIPESADYSLLENNLGLFSIRP